METAIEAKVWSLGIGCRVEGFMALVFPGFIGIR